jgi:hypothetical protein
MDERDTLYRNRLSLELLSQAQDFLMMNDVFFKNNWPIGSTTTNATVRHQSFSPPSNLSVMIILQQWVSLVTGTLPKIFGF